MEKKELVNRQMTLDKEVDMHREEKIGFLIFITTLAATMSLFGFTIFPDAAISGTGDKALVPTVIEGTIASLDREENRVIIESQGGSHLPVSVQIRTRIYLNGERADFDDLKVGDHIVAEFLVGPKKAIELLATRPDV